MKILIIDIGGTGVDYALRFQNYGHDVKLFFAPRRHTNVGRGLVSHVKDWRAWMDWADMIVMTDINKYVDDLQEYFDKGYPIFGTNKNAMQLETDRELGQDVIEHCGLQIIPYTKFEDIDEAIQHVIKAGDDTRFVSKPCGDGGTAMSYVSKSASDMVYMLERWKKLGKLKQPFILQEFCKGIEMGVGGWFGPGGWLDVWEENFEHKKLMPGDKGPNTGEMGTAMKYCERSNLASETLEKFTNVLHALKFVGNVDLNVMINKDGIWPMEWTMRMGWPAAMIQCSLHKGDPAHWMYDLLQGKDSLKVSYDHAIGVVVAIPDFPYSHLTQRDVEGIPIYGINEKNIRDIHLCEVMAGSAPIVEGTKVRSEELFVTAGDYIYVAVGRGDNIATAADKAYSLIDQVDIPNSPLYRIDIGKRLEKQLPELKKLGFAESWKYE